MKRPLRIVRNIGIGLAALILALAIAGVQIVRSAWFANYVKQIIVTSVEDASGGRAEVGGFRFDWTHSTVVLTGFAIHGTEAADAAAMLRVARVQANFRLFTSLHHLWDITYLGIERPQANVIVNPDGHTNVPSPRRKAASNKSPLEPVVDLAIGRFEIADGLIAVAGQKQALNIRGNNLRAQLFYNILSQDYRGQFSLQPVYVVSGKNTPVNFTVNVPLSISRNRIDMREASIFSSGTAITFTASIQDLKDPKLTAHANGHIALADLKNAAGLPLRLAKNTPAIINLDSDVNMQNNTIAVTGIHAEAFGGDFAGDASAKDFSAYQVRGNLRHLDFANAMRALGQAELPYDGVLSGPVDIQGNFKAGLRGMIAQAKLSVAPAPRVIPLSGNLTARYTGASDDLSIQKSLLTLPHSRFSVDGSMGKQLNVAVTTSNLEDFFNVLPRDSRPPVALLAGGEASFRGNVMGNLTSPTIRGHVTANRFRITDRQFDSFAADADVTKNGVALQNGSLDRDSMEARFSGTLGLTNWKALPSAPLAVEGAIQRGDLADLLAMAGQPSKGYSGQVNASLKVGGTLGNPTGAGSVAITKGVVEGQPFDRAEAQVDLSDQLVSVQNGFVQLGASRVNVKGEFRHAREQFTTGQLRADIQSDRIDLAQFAALQKELPNTTGTAQINASVTANLSGAFQLTGVDGKASVRGLQSAGQNYGDVAATASTSGQAVNYNLTSNFAGSTIHVDGSTQLSGDYRSTAHASFDKLPVEQILAVAKRGDIGAKGLLSGTADFAGTIKNPTGSADLTLTNASIYDDAVDHVHLTAQYDQTGRVQFHMDTATMDLARFKTLTQKQPGLTGTLQVSASGSAEVRSTEPRILLRDLTGNLKTTGLAIQGKSLGDVTLTANTAGGRTNFTLDSRIAGAAIEGHGSVQLANDYPTEAQLTFKNATWAGLRPFLGYETGEGRGFEATADGQASLNGPLTNVEQLRGSIQVTHLEVSGAASTFRKTNKLVLQNQGPIAATLERGALKIQSAHLSGPQTDFQASGSVPLNGQAVDIALKGNVNLAILQQFDDSITSSGSVTLAAGVRGSLDNPRLTGQVELHNAAFDTPDLPTGISKANGVIALNGNSAVIRNLSAEAGGGQVTMTGSATLNGSLRFSLAAMASRVRLRIQQGLGVVGSANVNLAGTPDSSALTGTVTLEQVSYAAKSDLGSLLSLAAPPVQAPSTPLPLFENMRLDIRVRSSSALGVQSTLAQNVQLTSDLRMRGTMAHPGVLGRVLITEGKLVFFGSTYTVNSGTIGFYNPVRIEPILDLSLETQTQGVNVVLKVTGPIDNMKLSYTSDPPLQFQEIVGLLATGATPTSDPTLLANSPQIQPQNFQQMGESAIVGRALADPVTNQLQRVFGVTQLKVNPAFTTGSQLPEAQLTLHQQVSNNLAFTYVTGLNTANAETIQVVWTFTPQWSAQALRDYNGIFSVTLLFKKQFR